MKRVFCMSNDLAVLTDCIHDCYFSVDKVSFQSEQDLLNIEYEKIGDSFVDISRNFIFFKVVKVPVYACRIVIHNVQSYTISDTEKVEWYDFNKIIFRDEDGTLSIQTGIPLGFEIKVGSLQVVLEETDLVLRHEKRVHL